MYEIIYKASQSLLIYIQSIYFVKIMLKIIKNNLYFIKIKLMKRS